MAQQYDVNAGLDISALSSVTQAQLMQMVQQIAPLSNIGGIIYQSTTPDVASNARFARYIWLDSTTSPPVAKYYDGASWTAVAVSALSITNAEVSASAAIAVTKLAPGTARYVLRTNAAGTANEFITPASALNSNELGVIKLTAAGSDSYLKTVAGVSQWVDQTTERAAISAALSGLSPTVLSPGSNNTLLGTNGSGVVGFAAIGSLLANNAIGLNLLATGGAAASDVLKFDGANWVKITPGLAIFDSHAINSGTTSGFLSTAVHTIAHNLVTRPRGLRVVAVQTNAVAEAGYNQNDEVDITGMFVNASNSALATVSCDTTNVTIALASTTDIGVMHKSTGADTAITEGNWQIKVYAWK